MIYKAKRGKAEFALRTLTFRLIITLETAPNICYLDSIRYETDVPCSGEVLQTKSLFTLPYRTQESTLPTTLLLAYITAVVWNR